MVQHIDIRTIQLKSYVFLDITLYNPAKVN
jgi:hypothetical protein